MSEPLLYLESGAGSAAFNMAMDEGLLMACAEWKRPVLRFYSWSEPAATFGYFQRYADVESWTHLRPLVRRPTGGGLVPHERDWTYSLAFPQGHFWCELKALESYLRLHRWLQEAFRHVRIRTDLAPHPEKEALGRCFAGPDQYDLVHCGKKIAGAAQRRTKHGLLIQGSIQETPVDSARSEWEQAMLKTAEAAGGFVCEELRPNPELLRTVQELQTEKYLRPEHNQRR